MRGGGIKSNKHKTIAFGLKGGVKGLELGSCMGESGYNNHRISLVKFNFLGTYFCRENILNFFMQSNTKR